MEPKKPDAKLSARLPDPIADALPSGKFLKRLQEMAVKQQASERNA